MPLYNLLRQYCLCLLLISVSTIQANALSVALAVPQGLTARASYVKAVALQWQPVADASAYTIERSASGQAGSFTQIKTVPGTQTYFRDTGLSVSQQLFYRVKATADGQESAYSEIVSATTNPDEKIRIMPLGDSNTFGGPGNSTTSKDRIGYRKELYKQLVLDGNVQGYSVDFVGSEHSGENYQSSFKTENGFDLDIDHAGFGGARDEDIAVLLRDGEFKFYGGVLLGPGGGPYLDKYNPDVILLHIGTNWVDGSSNAMNDVKGILDQVELYEARAKREVTVIVAKIIRRVCYTDAVGDSICPTPTEAENTLRYNSMLETYVNQRIAAGDRLQLVDMQDGAGLVYKYESEGGEMQDNLHPTQEGYNKMAQVWFSAITDSDIVPLPVELMSFAAAPENSSVLLKWVTASENDNSRFEVERMQESGAFSRVGTVAGAGDSQGSIRYTFRDVISPKGTLYYRLKQVDFSGAYSYSKVVAVRGKDVAGPIARLFPNLTDGSDNLHLTVGGYGADAPVAIILVNSSGERVLHQTLRAGAKGTLTTDLILPAHLSKGLYVLKVMSPGNTQNLKLVVQ